MCQDEPCTSSKTTCVSAPASSQSLYPYTCTCNTGLGFIQVGKRSGLENEELCVLSSAQTTTCSCGPNTNCKYVEGSKVCECLQGFVGDASSSTSGCEEITPSVVLVLQGTMQIPLLFQAVLLYNYSIEYSQGVSQVEDLINRILKMVTGYILYSTNVTSFKPCGLELILNFYSIRKSWHNRKSLLFNLKIVLVLNW